MKSDLDFLMQAENIDAILVTGPGQHNPAMVYLTGGAHLTNADLIKKRGKPPLLFCYPMEREEAAATGLATHNLGDYRLSDLVKQFDGDQIRAAVERYRLMLADLGIASGRILLYGRIEAGAAYALFSGSMTLSPPILSIFSVPRPNTGSGAVTSMPPGRTATFGNSYRRSSVNMRPRCSPCPSLPRIWPTPSISAAPPSTP